MNPPPNVSSPPTERDQFNAELEQFGMKPLWVIYREVMTREPRAREVPYLWAWDEVRPRLLRQAHRAPHKQNAKSDSAKVL